MGKWENLLVGKQSNLQGFLQQSLAVEKPLEGHEPITKCLHGSSFVGNQVFETNICIVHSSSSFSLFFSPFLSLSQPKMKFLVIMDISIFVLL